VALLSAEDRSVEAYRRAYIDGTSGLLKVTAGDDVSFVYVSSTGVFGQADGGWVDEATPPRPADAIADVLVAAERLVLDPSRMRACIVRCSGLYGPERTGTIERVRTGALALGPTDGTWMNFCHRDDAADTVIAALSRGRPGATYHASDGLPTTRHDVVSWIAARLAIAPARRAGESVRQSRHATNRRVSADATRRELGVSLAYPTFRDGFAPLLP
jgi:nucleoside-diphosphate-sugar epimerase